MRSELVFTAMDRVKNPFLLFHLVRVSSRRFHKSGACMQNTINGVLERVQIGDSIPADVMLKERAA
ncbi:MAG: hypothetical protein JWO13_3768 [Acidobacteriales bacterium]|nr:hypothetical protein [Terriglobales bacterium]